MTVRRLTIAGAAAVSLVLTGCQSTDQQTGQTLAALAGGLGGALLGAQFGKGTGQMVGVAVGALAGTVAGSMIYGALTKEDQAAVRQTAATALNAPANAQPTEWKNPDTGTTAQVAAAPPTTEVREVKIVREKKVAPAPGLELIGAPYQTTADINVRAAPSTGAEIMTGLKNGETVTAVGKVAGGGWIMVARGKRTIGYVSAGYLAPAAEKTKPALKAPADIDKEIAAEAQARDLAIDTVTAKTECRAATSTITDAKGETEKSQFTACKAADGAWEITG